MKIKLFMVLALSHELFAFMSPEEMMDKMTMKNAKAMMMMPLHPQEKISQGIRLMEKMSHALEIARELIVESNND